METPKTGQVVPFDATRPATPKVIMAQKELLDAVMQLDTFAGAFGAIVQAVATNRDRLVQIFPVLLQTEGTNFAYSAVIEMLARVERGEWK